MDERTTEGDQLWDATLFTGLVQRVAVQVLWRSQFSELIFLQRLRNCRNPRARVISQHSYNHVFQGES